MWQLPVCDRQALRLQHVQSPMLLDSREQTKDLSLMAVDTCDDTNDMHHDVRTCCTAASSCMMTCAALFAEVSYPPCEQRIL